MPGVARTRSPLRILIVDRDRHVRHSLTGLMNLADELLVVGAVADSASALAQIDLVTPDVVLVDPRLPELADGLNLMRRLSERWPSIRIVAMSCWDEFENPALRTGAAAFVSKGGQPGEFVQAVVSAGGRRPGRR